MYKEQSLGMLVRLRPEEAKKAILKAVRQSGGHVINAAKALNVGQRSLFRWITTLGMKPDIEAIKMKHGMSVREK